MRRFYLIVVVILLFSVSTSAQNLLASRRSSYYTVIYQVSNEQARKLYKDIWDIDTTFLKKPYDFFPTDSTYRKDLPVGHFVFVKTIEGKLTCELQSVNNLNMTLLNNHRDLVMVFNDLQGRERDDVKVRVRSRRVPFQKNVKAYRLSKSNKRGIVSAEYNGHVSFFEIDRKYNNTFFVRTGKTILRTFPVNMILSPFFYVGGNIKRLVTLDRPYAPGIYYRVARIFQPKARRGYLVLNKPKFKPYDTVRFKAMLTNKKGKPVGKKVDVYLNKYWPDPFSKKIATLTPFSKGAYHYEFKLSDSLNLKLDQGYTIELKGKRRNSLLSTSFRYEDYQLINNFYSARSERKSKGKPATPCMWRRVSHWLRKTVSR